MPRMIDADTLFDFLTEQLEKETGAYSKGRNAGINIARSALHDTTITPTITPPPNDPLTLEQLREMGGEPYWHVGLQDDSPPPHWSILDPFFAKHIEDYGYGVRWFAYRRKPEEGTYDN